MSRPGVKAGPKSFLHQKGVIDPTPKGGGLQREASAILVFKRKAALRGSAMTRLSLPGFSKRAGYVKEAITPGDASPVPCTVVRR